MRLSDHRIRRNPLLIILSSPAMVPGPPVTQLAPRRHLQRPCGPRGIQLHHGDVTEELAERR